jgi:hypothetical protein
VGSSSLKQLEPERALPRRLGKSQVEFALLIGVSPVLARESRDLFLDHRLGQRGQHALRGTRVSLRVSYAFQTGVAPEVTFEPMLVPLVRADLFQKAIL